MLTVDTNANVGYGLLLRDMARLSEYFCEKANACGLVGVLLVTVSSYQNILVCEVTYNYLARMLFLQSSGVRLTLVTAYTSTPVVVYTYMLWCHI